MTFNVSFNTFLALNIKTRNDRNIIKIRINYEKQKFNAVSS